MVNLFDSNGRSLYFSNRKEYYRRKKISIGLLKRFKPRTRKQVAYNDNYIQSIRAIVINGNQTEQQLENAIKEFLQTNERLLRFNLKKSYKGFEEERIDADEDKEFKDGVLYLEINLNMAGIVEVIEW